MEETDFFDSIKNHYEKKLPFVVFKKPNKNTVKAFLQSNAVLNTSDSFNKKGFVFSPFSNKNNDPTVWLYNEECTILETSFIAKKYNYSLTVELNLKAKVQHVSKVKKAIEQIKLNELKKVIISRTEEHEVEIADPINWFKKCINFYPSAFSYCWYHPKIGLWLGASPETLVSLKENKFSTMALAGTLPYNESLDVKWEVKELEEQQLVVDSILESLKEVAKSVDKNKTITQKAGSLVHLKTEIKGEIKTKNNIKVLLEILHPTSAVCGIPKEKSKEYILKEEGYNRKYYTGILGEFNTSDTTDLFVNLRCLEIENNIAKIYVGGGVTKLSNAEKEWEETLNKLQTMKKVLN